MVTKRTFDIVISFLALLFLFPVFIIISAAIIIDSKGAVLFRQRRVGRNKVDFDLLKFRTMESNASKLGLLTIGDRDARVTRVGYWLRKYKLDELPQLLNVLKGDMSLVGPRPEVKRYADLYNPTQQRVFEVKPGITDWASIQFCNESELLAQYSDPEVFYVQELLPAKLAKNLSYIEHHDLWIDLKIICLTLRKIVKK
ncbi:sugar transferase [Desertivirga xinjiangensis]|uniref:sugar transferase n=1 Tax=Desertivirga xinjiangensis TaxID=539206 RepID=UPI00210C7826|nr:sugar transferase [Pedobacter xinjiangensis]